MDNLTNCVDKNCNCQQQSFVTTMINCSEIESNLANSSSVVCGAVNKPLANNKVNNFQTMSNSALMTTTSAKVSSNSNKMGSRRIFSPQFKIQVLDSYRNDNQCKGNQRATARKYDIHRRQIQKWLQCETTLRASVLNINNSSGSNGRMVDSNNNNNSRKPVLSAITFANSSASSVSTVPKESHSNSDLSPNASSSSSPTSSSSSSLTKGIILSLADPARHSVADNTLAFSACGGVSEKKAPHTSPISSEFFSPQSLIINVSGGGGGNNNNNAENKIDLMNGRKPEFVEQHHQHHHQNGGLIMASSSSVASTPFGYLNPGHSYPYSPQIHPACLYPPQFEYQAPISLPIDLSIHKRETVAKWREANERIKEEPADDARVPINCQNNLNHQHICPILTESPLPMDLSCSRKRKCEEESKSKPVKLFKPYLLDNEDEEEDDKEEKRGNSKSNTFLENNVARSTKQTENPFIWSHPQYHQTAYPCSSSPAYDSYYYSPENLTFYPSPIPVQSPTSSSAASPILSNPSSYDSGVELNHSWTSVSSSENTSPGYSPIYDRTREPYCFDLKFHPIDHEKWFSPGQDLRQRIGYAF